jgi:hypothetical protein
MKLALLFTILMSWTLIVQAQAVKRHPRVMEIERMLQSDVQSSVRDVLPGQSFHVKVIVDPLHRQTVTGSGKEALPYFEASDEIKDEWDDPNRSDFELLSRVNRISVKAYVPGTLSPEQVAEVKAAITNRVPYVEGRDLVEIEQKNWPLPPDHNRYTSWILGLGLVMMLLLGFVYFIVSSVAITRITKAIKTIKFSAAEGGGGGGAMAPSFAAPQGSAGSGGGFGSGQVQMNDTIRMTEVILGLIKNFESSKTFPTLDDMTTFEHYFNAHPSSVGALLAEFPSSLKGKVFSYSYSNSWLKGLTDPGEIDHTAFELMNKLARIERGGESTSWDELLILCWRLESALPAFLKKLDSSDSLLILKSLPQSIAIQTARELMPGEWAAVLKRGGPTKTLSEDKIEKYKKMALEAKPLRSLTVLNQYRKDTDLIKYLKVTDPVFEKEIYGAAPPESALSSLRPPFYPVLDAASDELKDFTSQVSIEDWSLALLNVPRALRSNVEATFSDKQKFRLVELLKRYDRAPVDPAIIGDARERIGRFYKDFAAAKQKAHVVPELASVQDEAA